MAVPIGIASDARSPLMPDTPTLSEQGFEGAEVDIWWGVFTSAGTPDDVVEKLNADIRAVLGTEAAAEFLDGQGALPYAMSVEEFTAHYRNEIVKWRDLVAALEITTE